MINRTSRRPAPAVRAQIATLRHEIAGCTVGKFATYRLCYAERARLDAQLTELMAELVPDGLDARFVTPSALAGVGDDVVADLLAAARWTAESADRADYGGVCDGDCALDSIGVIEREMDARGLPVPAW